MSNAKIIAIIDHENRALRSDVTATIATAVAVAAAPLQTEIDLLRGAIEQLTLRISALEQAPNQSKTDDGWISR